MYNNVKNIKKRKDCDLMKLKRIFGLVLAVCMLLSTSVFAQTTSYDGVLVKNQNVEKVLSSDLEKNPNFFGKADFSNPIPNSMRDKLKSAPARVTSNNISDLAVDGDAYESNNSYSTATQGLKGRLVRANIHSDSDVDWYSFDVTQYEVNSGQYFSFVLSNIPLNCDYDMFVASSDFTGVMYNIQSGSTPEEFFVTFNKAGTYYVVIQTASGYSSSNYNLYFGSAYKSKSTEWRSTGLSFNFGYIPTGRDYNTWSSWQSYNLTNDSTIPNGSVVSDIYLDDNGNGAYWIGFYKAIKDANGYGMVQFGNIDNMNFPEMTYYVKQNWFINGYVSSCNYFVWNPNIKIDYIFIVQSSTLGYL